MTRLTSIAIFPLWFCLGCASTQDTFQSRQGDANLQAAETVILNAKFWTGAGAEAQSAAIRGDRLVAVGTNDEIRRFVGGDTQVIDAEGRRVIPGLTDAHCHIVSGGLQLARLNLREADSREAFVAAVAAAAKETRPGQWVLGGRWSVESWDDSTPPRKDWIDAVTPDTPVFLSRMDGHQALANSVALRIAGISVDGPPDPPGGDIDRDPDTGEPTGILKDDAMDLVYGHIPEDSEEDRYAALRRAMHHANAYGITSMHDLSGREDLAAMFRAQREGALTVRIRKYVSVSDWTPVIEQVKGFDNHDWLRVMGFKGYMDGSLGSRTAFMYRPYADANDASQYPSGLLLEMSSPPKKIRFMIERADAAGLQSAIHAIGDEANHILLDAYAAVARANGPRERRHRIEHAQHVIPSDLPRFAELGVVASMQPYHKADDGRYAENALGEERLRGSYAFRTLMHSGAIVAFGSDWPVVTCDPFAGMAAAVTGRTLDGKTWIPEENITIEEALQAYTRNPAIAAFDEENLGTIEPGKLADIVMLSQDVLNVPSEKIGNTRAVLTMAGGKIVFDAR